MKDLAETLKQLRRAKGATQQQVADAIGKSIKSYQKYEEGKAIPPTKVLPAILHYYSIKYEELINI